MTGRLHNLDVEPSIDFSPWPRPSGAFALEMRARFELGLGGADFARTAGVVVLGGVRFRFDLIPKMR